MLFLQSLRPTNDDVSGTHCCKRRWWLAQDCSWFIDSFRGRLFLLSFSVLMAHTHLNEPTTFSSRGERRPAFSPPPFSRSPQPPQIFTYLTLHHHTPPSGLPTSSYVPPLMSTAMSTSSVSTYTMSTHSAEVPGLPQGALPSFLMVRYSKVR